MMRFEVIGRLTKDPVIRYTSNSTAVIDVDVATRRNYKNQNGEYQSDFFRLIAWRKQAETIANLLRKGSMVEFRGRIENNNYEDKDGKMVYTNNFIINEADFLADFGKNQQGGGQQQNNQNQGQGGYGQGGGYNQNQGYNQNKNQPNQNQGQGYNQNQGQQQPPQQQQGGYQNQGGQQPPQQQQGGYQNQGGQQPPQQQQGGD